jgi:predicted amidophosphoribosyltransferase
LAAATVLYTVHGAIEEFDRRWLRPRLSPDHRLTLPWPSPASSTAPGDEVIIRAPADQSLDHARINGTVESIDPANEHVLLRVDQLALDESLDDPTTALGTAQRPLAYSQAVFMLPQELAIVDVFAVGPARAINRTHRCHLPIIPASAARSPPRLLHDHDDYVPAFWVLQAGSFVYRTGRHVRSQVDDASALCLRFKFGETARAAALAVALYEALTARNLGEFDCVTPIPLSPEKAAAGKPHRARELSVHLAGLLGVDVVDLFSLRTPISKGARRAVDGLSPSEFETEYAAALEVDNAVRHFDRLLIVDDICNQGSTFNAVLAGIRSVRNTISAVAAAAGQVANPASVRDQDSILR